ncbi:MAG: cobaltochelatase subunit CobN [Deltaproteobacteria bacterium]|jgi:cobaltochelatase CobN|nr:cobaltochelatase subunit CobN [Deltaproteobacteria bacterium]
MNNIVCLVWTSYALALSEVIEQRVQESVEAGVRLFSSKALEDPKVAASALKELESARMVLLVKSSDAVFEQFDQIINSRRLEIPVVSVGYDPSFWVQSSVSPENVQRAYQYILFGGSENFGLLFDFIIGLAKGDTSRIPAPRPVPWEGLWHPEADRQYFPNVLEYLRWYRDYRQVDDLDRPWVGLLLSRHYWNNRVLELETALIDELEKQGFSVIAAFTNSFKDISLGNKGAFPWAREVFLDGEKSRVDILIKMLPYFSRTSDGQESEEEALRSGIDSPANESVAFFTKLNVPVFQPVFSNSKTLEDWENSLEGLGTEVAWNVAMPEFEGVIEPFFLGGTSVKPGGAMFSSVERRVPHLGRIKSFCARLSRWIRLAKKPIDQRKVAFILHNDPCASVEATVGGAAKLDSLESMAEILRALQNRGYKVNVPENGQELIKTIMDRKAISEFRWTTVQEIVGRGGALDLVELSQYQKWFEGYPRSVQDRLSESWGPPPGREQDGIPAAMVFEDKIVITGINMGQAVILVQPKRGCAGSRCDGQVCKILHDPDVPPPHQYIATYRWLQDIYGADLLIHVGTHGTLEFLPGKSVGLSESCLPDLTLHQIPHIYIYNSDNPAEGTIAKRRSYAVIIDHLQTVMARGEAEKDLQELESYLEQWERAKTSSPVRAHQLERLILEEIKIHNLTSQVKPEVGDFAQIVKRSHETISLLSSTAIDDGMHIFGQTPVGQRRGEFIYSIMRADVEGSDKTLRRLLAQGEQLDLDELLADPGSFDELRGRSRGKLLADLENRALEFCKLALELATSPQKRLENVRPLFGSANGDIDLTELLERFDNINLRLDRTDEINSLASSFQVHHAPAGPSGIITRGQYNIIPTGRNFFSLDPRRLPTKAAYRVGENLATALVDKFLREEGRYPENMAMFWMCNDMMWADGEGMSQIMSLLGVKPIWRLNGQVSGFTVLSLEELGRPRIDVTIRMSGLLRDSFPEAVNLIDECVMKVAELDEPVEQNFIRKHTLDNLKNLNSDDESNWRKATFRIFCAQPGVYRAGVELAVYASAWETEKDLAEIFIHWNAYAYGKGTYGVVSPRRLEASLATVDFTYNKVVTDEHDLLGCCGYYGTHGGMAVAANYYKGQKVKNYYGDTREPQAVKVRDLSEEIRRVVRAKLLNPKWIEGMKRHGYKGAGDISKRAGRVYGWEAATEAVDDWIFDEITKTFVLNEENRHFFEEHNPYALEEIERRLLEAESRGLWQPDPKLLAELKQHYLNCEGLLEEKMEGFGGEFQGGSIDVITSRDVDKWRENLEKSRLKDS